MNKIITLIMCVAFSVTMSGQTIKVEDRVKALEGDVKKLKGQLETQKCQLILFGILLLTKGLSLRRFQSFPA